MSTPRFANRIVRLAASAVLSWTVAITASQFAEAGKSCAQQDTAADSRSPIELIRAACPMLGEIVERFALMDLGEDIVSEHPRTHDVAMIAAVMASADPVSARRYAEHARDAGATPIELEAALYLVTLQAGVPKAIAATRVMADLLPAQPTRCLPQSASADLLQF